MRGHQRSSEALRGPQRRYKATRFGMLSGLKREAISMQSSCNQHAISMQSACNQHARSRASPVAPQEGVRHEEEALRELEISSQVHAQARIVELFLCL